MDEPETKTCQNCKREIPAVNFTIHSVHCARNIRVCLVCKEPVQVSELEAHHEKLHKLLPCKQCGEMVCGTDMEDHIRDSCANTIKMCRFCDLEVTRRELPHHEGYCGARTEQCSECGEWVMLKYRQLHLDSNHGFLRLDDDPVPAPRTAASTFTNFPKLADWPKMSNPGVGFNRPDYDREGNDAFRDFMDRIAATPRPVIRRYREVKDNAAVARGVGILSPIDNFASRADRDGWKKHLNSRTPSNATKKRPAPKPPGSAPSTSGPSTSRMLISPLTVSPPSPASPASPTSPTSPTTLTSLTSLPSATSNTSPTSLTKAATTSAKSNSAADSSDDSDMGPGEITMKDGVMIINPPALSSGALRKLRDRQIRSDRLAQQAAKDQKPEVKKRDDLKDLKPMSPEQFLNRFKELQLGKEPAAEARAQDRAEPDRFSEIKSSLKELRRGLNEVTAPYNANSAINNNITLDFWRQEVQTAAEEGIDSDEEGARGEGGGLGDVRLPCEFCGTLVPAANLVLHQTGCRPDLARLAPVAGRAPPARPRSPPPPPLHEPAEPVIPCEFCTEPLPIYLLSEHQERCGREANLLFPD